MAVEVLMPKLGATMETGTIISWLKNEGEVVQVGEPILEIMTDKINMELEATNGGILLKKLYDNDSEVPVLVPIAYIGDPGETIVEKTKTIPTIGIEKKNEVELAATDDESADQHSNESVVNAKIRRTPAARKLAKSHGVDLSKVQGTGTNHRIHLKDVKLFIEKSSKSISPLAQKMAEQHHIDSTAIQTNHNKIQKEDVLKEITRRPASTVNYHGIRKVVGERMAKSAQTVPHVTLNTEVDMSSAIQLRNSLIESIKRKTGQRLSFTEIIIKSVAYTLKSHPMLNSSLNGNVIELHSDINIGLAVSIPNGLVVPVIRNADHKGFAELTEESKNLAKKARENRITSDDLHGGTFTISNLGMYAVDSFTPIINQPESAILGVGRIREQVISINGKIDARPFMSLSLSFDHRVIDGAPAAQFLTDLKEILENPYELMV
jgi:pyruvate dehydrogenase E2 component (dihydrolipoamide acetyltransferase)